MRVVALLSAVFIFPALSVVRPSDPASPEPPFRVDHRFEAGSGKAGIDVGRAVLIKLEGVSPSGQARFTFKDGMAPPRFTIRLAGAGPLQHLSVGNGRFTLTT